MRMHKRAGNLVTIVQVCAGTCFEVFDLLIFGYFAPEIARAYFPSHDSSAALLLTFATFGAGYLVRPLGAFVLGAYIDRAGRRRGLIVTLSLMCIGTFSIAATPTYDAIGLMAPVIVVMGRLLQGFSAGAEQGGVSVYLAEIAPPGRTGLYVSLQSASAQLSAVLAATLGVVLTSTLNQSQLNDWGWRVPFLFGCLLVPLLFVLRRSLMETEAFSTRKRPEIGELFRSICHNWRIVTLGTVVGLMTTVSFYTLNGYTPTFGRTVLHLSSIDSLVVTFLVALANFVWLPLGGSLSDRIGRSPILIACSVLAILTAYPAMVWLTVDPSFFKLLCVELWLSVLYGFYNGAQIAFIVETVPLQVRALGFSLAYSLAATIGGFTPVADTWLIRATGNNAMPGVWLGAAALVALIAVVMINRKKVTPVESLVPISIHDDKLSQRVPI
jgi:MFS transporter, MHS family, citrate/tricarballylate:H+ symporter